MTGGAIGATRRALCAALLCLPFAACTVLPGADGPPPRLFVLSPKSTYDPNMPRTEWQIGIEVPLAEAGLNTARIALRHSPLSLDYFERANWIDSAPRMVQTLIVESFENSGKTFAVARASVGLRSDFVVVSELREFQAEYEGTPNPTVRVRLNIKLVKMPQRVIVGAINVERQAPAAGGRLEDVVLAFDDALGKVLRQTVDWTLRTLPPKPRDAEGS